MPGFSRGLLLMACCVPWAYGQYAEFRTYPKIEWYAGYSAIETNDHTFQFTNIGAVGDLDFDEKGKGFETAVIGNVSRHFSLVGDFSAHFSSNRFSIPITTGCSQPPCPSATQNGTINPWLFYFLGGPEVKWRNHSRITPFANALFGIAHSTATFNTTGSVINLSRIDAENGFGMAINGGFDLRISRRVGLRGFLTRSEAFIGSNVLAKQRVNALGWSIGVLFH
jgi:hypothetical protein